MEILVKNPTETQVLAEKIGQCALPQDVLILSGELGAGKTTLTKGIALGLEIEQMIKSPTYTIVREYSTGRLPLYHMDVYRVGAEADDLALDEYFEGDGLSVVEWGNLLEAYMPEDYLELTINKDAQDVETRKIVFTAHGTRATAFLARIHQALGA